MDSAIVGIENAITHIPASLHNSFGKVFYSQRDAFRAAARLYVLGVNPGGDPNDQSDETVADADSVVSKLPHNWSDIATSRGRGGLTGRMECGRGFYISSTGLGSILAQDRPAILSSCVPDETGHAPVLLNGHGELHTGLGTSPDGGELDRPYICIWIDPADDQECQEYRFYQFFKPEVYILEPGDIEADGSRSPDATPEQNLPEFPAATGLKFKFNRWNPDYHKDESQAEDRQRRRDGKPRLPRHRPSHLTPPAGGPKAGKPYIQYTVPGTNPNGATPLPGLLDGPNFSNRPQPDELSPVELSFLDKIRPRRARGDQPPSGEAVVEVFIELETCLACVDDGQYECRQCLTWTYTERTTLRTEWTEDDGADGPPAMGISNAERHWTLGTQVIRSSATINIGAWGACP